MTSTIHQSVEAYSGSMPGAPRFLAPALQTIAATDLAFGRRTNSGGIRAGDLPATAGRCRGPTTPPSG